MSEATDFARARRLPAAEAVAYMEGRSLTGETFSAYDLWRDEHSRAFTVSRLARADLLEAMQASLAKSVQGDLTRRDWIRSTETLLRDAGWWGTNEVTDPRTGEVLKTRFNHARLQLIFDTNVRQAQAAGQWQRMLRHRRTHPYARYVTADDGRVRPLHRSWHNVTLPLDDTWWETHRPPNGYRCRCRVIGVTQREYDAGVVLDRPGAELDRNAPVRRTPMVKQRPPVDLVEWENPATGRTEYIPAGIDPGFDYNAGTTGRSQAFDDLVQAKLARLSSPVARAAEAGRLRSGLPSETFEGQRPGLFELPDVAITRIDRDAFGPGLSHQALVAKATEALKALQRSDGLVNDDTGWLLRVNREAVKKIADNEAQSAVSLQAIKALTDLVRNAVVVERHPDTRHRNPSVRAIYRLAVPLQIGEALYRVKLTVKDFQQGREAAFKLHALDAAEIEGAPLGTLPNSPAEAGVGTTQPTTGRTITVADLLRGATLQDGTPFTPD